MVPNPGEADAISELLLWGFILNKRVDNAAYLQCVNSRPPEPSCKAGCGVMERVKMPARETQIVPTIARRA